MVDAGTLVGLALAAFAGGAFGAAVGGYPAFSLAGLVVVAGEAAKVAGRAATDAARTAWFPLADLPETAFDHGRILRDYSRFLETGERHALP